MTQKTKSTLVRLCNKSYEIKCPENEAQTLQHAAQKLNEYILKKKKSHKQLDDFQALLLAALHISHELVSAQEQLDQQQAHIREFINSLEQRMTNNVRSDFMSESLTH